MAKTIAVFGASGLTASECVYQALQEGDTVVGLTRNPANLKIPKGSGGPKAEQALTSDNLILLAGDVTKKSDVDKVFAAAKIDGVVVALGGKTKEVGDSMLTDGTKNIIAAMKENDVKRLAVVTSIGAGKRYIPSMQRNVSTMVLTSFLTYWKMQFELLLYCVI